MMILMMMVMVLVMMMVVDGLLSLRAFALAPDGFFEPRGNRSVKVLLL